MAENVEQLPDSSIEKSSSGTIDVTEKEMLKQLIEKQNEQDKINKKVLENQQKLMEELRLIRNKQNGTGKEQVDINDSIDNPTKRADLDTSTVDKSGEEAGDPDSTGSTSSAENQTLENTGKCFTLKHTFKNVSKLENGMKAYSDHQEHFGIDWRILIQRNKEHLAFYTSCRNKKAKGMWSFKMDFDVEMLSRNGNPLIHVCCDEIKTFGIETIRRPLNYGWLEFEKWDVLEQKISIDDSLTFKVSINIEKMNGIYKNDLRCFDDPECSDVVLVVDDKNFYVAKLFLATHSPYFKAMFLGMFSDSKKSEIPLTGIEADDFQNYLEVLYGDDAIDEYTVEGILLVADMYDTPLVIKKCQQFLLKKSKKTLKKMLEMSVRFNLEELKKKCLSEIKNIGDIRRVIPGDIKDLDPSLMAILFEKALNSNTVSS